MVNEPNCYLVVWIYTEIESISFNTIYPAVLDTLPFGLIYTMYK